MNQLTTIAIQGAMDCEISALLKEMGEYKEEKHGGFFYYIGEIGELPVVVSKTDIGFVTAAASTTLLIEKYQPSIIINQGTAGGHDPKLFVYDLIIGNEVININGFRTGILEQGQGSDPTTWVHLDSLFPDENGVHPAPEVLTSDPKLVEIVLATASTYTYGKVVEGTIGSAEVWNREMDRIHWLRDTFNTSAEEMEAYPAGKIAKLNNIPYLSFRIISNSEVIDDDTEDLETAGIYCAEFAVEVVKAIGRNL
ncbi:5'-methylthioadenosine/S-adenosylhomocysteine nucleosidase [Ornithinibacillus halotolerans]|uniref:5-methylthioadenosine nucleosidase/S-adenosylhomocysteine nucleosidase n=1 Tax=Ornithinibacillus halotolerans TaxID=1274357 RepID=A0A916RLH8_9BACI|nr:5'-methylthioadenosine/S-adenosylhomocysteine nucleosidase [Ornithinibacillus halotolerans]GGA60595.1 5-methylthioadenosine nucleosidase/S-adenosylhomocysteine nucleosidase [Ornithinibacillus halotolerans]